MYRQRKEVVQEREINRKSRQVSVGNTSNKETESRDNQHQQQERRLTPMRKSLTSIATSMLILFALTGAAMADEGAASTSSAGVVNINTADVTQLAFLPRVWTESSGTHHRVPQGQRRLQEDH